MTIYLDYNATAPLRPQVMSRMAEILSEPLNASSVHGHGRQAKKILEDSRKLLAETISAFPGEIIFTATGSEANNMVSRGFPARKILASAVEHSSVLKASLRGSEATAAIQPENKNGIASPMARNDVIEVDNNGIIDLADLDAKLSSAEAALVSIMLANNETGVIQPMGEIAAICKKHGALLHTDAVQALGKIPVDFSLLGADLMTLSAHKMGGPVGAACLVVKQNLPIEALIKGGGQELNRRAGTENIAAIAGFAKAVELIDFARMGKLRGWLDAMESVILSAAKDLAKDSSPSAQNDNVLGKQAPRLPNTSCIAMPGVSSEVQLMDFDLKGFEVSAGSACSSGRIEPSHVLSAMKIDKKTASSAIRVSGGWNTAENDIISFTNAWKTLYMRLKPNS